MKSHILGQYNRTIFYTYLGVLALALGASLWVLTKNRHEAITELRQQVQVHQRQVEILLDSSLRAVKSLNQFAAKHLSLEEQPRSEQLLSNYAYNPIEQGFEVIPFIKEEVKEQFEIGMISGSGTLEARDQQYYREMDMLFQMNLSFPVAMEMVPDAAWIYYLSVNEFIGIYPWPGDDYSFSRDAYKRPSFLDATPQSNPGRSVFWTDVYLDDAGKGLMTTIGVPLYMGDIFHGVIALDLTLDSLSQQLKPHPSLIGQMMLLDKNQNILAASVDAKAVASEVITTLQQQLPPQLLELSQEELFNTSEGKLIGDFYVQAIHLVNAPFQLVYIEPVEDLFLESWRQFVIGFVSIMLALSILVSVVHWLTSQSFVSPASRLMLHLESCAKEAVDPPEDISAGWRPWFALISRIFKENDKYTRQLAEHNRYLDQQVAQRTEKLRETTERREREYALLRSLLDSIPEVIFYKNTQRQFIGSNQAAEQLFRVSEQELLGKKDSQFFPAELAKKFAADDAEVMEKQRVIKVQHWIEQDGVKRLWETLKTPYNNAKGELLGLIGIARDITKEYEAAEKLRHSEERYYMAMDAVEEGLWDWYIDTDKLHCNPAYFTMLGYAPHDVMPSWDAFQRLVHPDDWQRVEACLMRHLADPGKAYEQEFRMLANGGGFEWILSRGSVVEYNEAGEPLRMLGTHKNITKRKEFEVAMMQAKQEAEMANRYKSEFLANMSHEIRTPMNGILGMIQLALRTQLDHQQQDYLSKAHNSAHSLLHIINDILDFSKIEAGKMEIEQAPFRLEEVLDAVLNVNVIAAQQKGLELLLIAPTMGMELIGDTLRLNQVLTNLLSNAVKFTSEGEVAIRCELKASTPESVTLEFAVSDTGTGIAKSKLPLLFDAFSQADGSTTRQYGGSGLGLSISQHLVRMMGGNIEVESILGKGSCFRFVIELPLADGSEIEKWQLPSALQQVRMLLVEDNPGAQRVFKQMLTDFGFNVTISSDVDQALTMLREAADKEPFKLAVLDWDLPEQKSQQLLTDIAELDETPAVFVLGSLGDDTLQDEALQQQIDGILHKPLSPAAVKSKLNSFLEDAEQQERKAAPAAAVASESFKGLLLLVDDNVINQQVAKGLLKSQGYEVEIANNGQEAVDMVQQNSYKAVLMDIQMPVMDGLQATRLIREQFDCRQLPVIAMTAHAMSGDREKSLEAGMNDHITKPLVLKDMFETIERCIGESAQAE